MKKYKSIALLFPSLITSICLVSRVHTTAHDEHIKNEGALTTQTIKRIASESAAALPKPIIVATSRRVIGVESRL